MSDDTGSRFALLEIDGIPAPKPAPAIPIPQAAPMPAPAPTFPFAALAGPTPIPTAQGMTTSQGVAMSARMSRCYLWLRAEVATGFDPFWTDSHVARYATQIDAAIAKAEALPSGTEHRDDLVADLRAVRSRTPQARVAQSLSPGQVAAHRHASEQLVAVAEAGESTGAVVYWTLSGDLKLDNARVFWAEQGLPEDWLVGAPSHQVAFTRAVKAYQTRYRMARRHPDGGYQFTFEVAGKKDEPLRYETGPRLILKQTKGPLGQVSAEVVIHDSEGKDHAQAADLLSGVAAAYEENLRTVDADDAGAWLVWLCRRLGAVSLRQTGGIYFVPRDSVERFHKAKAVVTSCSAHRIFEIPAMKSEDAVLAILDAVGSEVDALVEDVNGRIEVGEMGSRAAKSRRDDVAAILEKIGRYKKLLNKPMPGARERLSAVDKRLADYTPRGSLLEVT